MNRLDIDAAKLALEPRRALPWQLSQVCGLLCLVALIPMLRYYYEHFRVVAWPLEVSGFPIGRDFVNLWSGGRAAWSGNYAALFDAKAYALDLQHLIHPTMVENGLVWSYPPTAFWLGLPFAKLSFSAALPLWYLAGFAAVLWVFRVDGTKPMPLWALPWLLLAPGVLMALYFAQTALLTTALFVGGLLLARDRPYLAGALLAGFVIKPHMGLVIPVVLLAMRQWRAFAATAVFSVFYVLLTVLAFGIEPWDLYLNVTLPKHLGLLTPWGLRLPWMFTAQYFQFLGAGFSTEVAMRLHWLVAVFAVAALAFTLPRLRDQNLRILLAAATTLLISPYMQSYELALPAIAGLRAAAYAPVGDDPDGSLRWGMVIVALMAPAVGLLTMLATGVNPVALLMLAIVVPALCSVWPEVAERQAWTTRLSRVLALRLRRSQRAI